MPPPEFGGPVSLAASESVKLLIPLSSAHLIWPALQPGDCQVRLIYDSSILKNFGIGGEGGNYINPFDVPSFEFITLESAEISVELQTDER